MRVEVSVCRTCRQFGRMLNNFGECGDCTEKRETNEALDHVEECLDNLRSGIMVGLRPAEATLGKRWLESQIKVVESVKEEFNNLSEAIKALRKDSE